MRQLGVDNTKTPGYAPNNNARAERGIGLVTEKARALLFQVGEGFHELWPCAIQHAAFCFRAAARYEQLPTSWPAFGRDIFSRIKDVPASGFVPRAREGLFLGPADGIPAAALVGRRTASGWELEASSSFVDAPCESAGADVPEEATRQDANREEQEKRYEEGT